MRVTHAINNIYKLISFLQLILKLSDCDTVQSVTSQPVYIVIYTLYQGRIFLMQPSA